ncbi:MAG: hypothetical protein ABL907_11595 [Hyphomicrobium sp.]
MSLKSLGLKVLGSAVVLSASAISALAWGLPGGHRHHAPEIDGPAGLAAVAFLVGAGMLAYNRFRKGS